MKDEFVGSFDMIELMLDELAEATLIGDPVVEPLSLRYMNARLEHLTGLSEEDRMKELAKTRLRTMLDERIQQSLAGRQQE
ncbi:MAG TPA: hypothetical protein VEH84_10285 [Alphaproteobacteria bacterium]|nr:hypothetical protein [Alphaproteobacteria bacterium]